jgi:rod shape-determining protein MreD
LAIFDITPNTAVVLIVCLAFLRNDVEGALIGLFAGLLWDIFYGKFIGFNALMYAVIGFLCGKPFKDYFRENYIFPITLTAASVFGYETVVYVTHFMLFGKTDTITYMYKIILPSTIYAVLTVFPLYWLVYKLNEKLEAREGQR